MPLDWIENALLYYNKPKYLKVANATAVDSKSDN